ncbi:MAG: hypothetical protein HZA93_10980 [Verrucomicrobia bacterium]|nr:hypothetical protein [Verrucomicrobiota bacterium]
MEKETVIKALTLLGQKAAAAGLAPEIAIYGGTVMMLAYNQREGTKDVDATFQPREALQPLITEVAAELALAPDRLNDQVGKFAPNAGPTANMAFDELAAVPGIRFSRPTARKMLAMKARAARLPRPGHGGDLHDLAFLITHTGTKSLAQIDETFERFYGEPLDDRQRLVAERALEIANERRHPPP